MNDQQTPAPLTGMLERADLHAIAGWAKTHGEAGPVTLELLINGDSAGTFPAETAREDLLEAGIGEGRHGFMLHLPRGLSAFAAHEIRVRRAGDGAELPGSPRTIPRAASPDEADPAILNEAARTTIQDALDAAAAHADKAEIEALIGFLARQTATLLFAHGSGLPDPQAALLGRWGIAPAIAQRQDDRPRALFIDESVPDPNRDAGSNAVLSHMRALARLGYRVDFIAAHGLEDGGARSHALADLGITCWHAPWIASVEEALHRLGERLKLVYVHRYGVMQRYGALVRKWCPAARLVYCVADLHYLRLARRIAVEAGHSAESGLSDMAPQAAGLRVAELMAVLGADAVITHSSFEQALLARQAPEANVHLVPWEVTPRPTEVPFARRSGVAFVGSYGHPPNLDAAYVLVEQIMPLVWAENPAIPCVLAGSDLPASLHEAARQAGPGRIEVLGHVGSLMEIWNRVRLATAPLRYGAGVKGKVLDSLAGGIPCVCLPMAAEGMDLPGTLAPLVADTPHAVAATILRLHDNEEACAGLAASGLAFIESDFGAPRVDAALAGAAGLHKTQP
jgi:glycosyltransferase involved in cell wall biosynthesis